MRSNPHFKSLWCVWAGFAASSATGASNSRTCPTRYPPSKVNRARRLDWRGGQRRSARDLGDRAAVGARRRAASARARQGDARARSARTRLHGALAAARDGDDRRRRLVRRRARRAGRRVSCTCTLGYASARSRISRQPPLRRRAEHRRPPRRRPALRRARHLGDAAGQRLRPSHARPALLAACEVDGRQPWFVVDVEVRQVFSHCGKAFVRSRLWQPETWPDPRGVRSPSRSIAEAVAEEERRAT